MNRKCQGWLYDLFRDTLTRQTFEGAYNSAPVWTPDGKRIVFESDKEGPRNVFWQLADSSGGLQRLTTSEYLNSPSSLSLDGKLLAFTEQNPTTGYDIWVLRLGDRKAQPFLRTPFTEGSHSFLPTDVGWPTTRMNPAALRFTCNPIPGQVGSIKSRAMAARSPCGIRTAGSCSTVVTTK